MLVGASAVSAIRCVAASVLVVISSDGSGSCESGRGVRGRTGVAAVVVAVAVALSSGTRLRVILLGGCSFHRR